MCVICSKLCNQRQNLKRHINGVHLKTQRFGCKYCGKEFIYQDSKIRHERKCQFNLSMGASPIVSTNPRSKKKSSGRFYGNQHVRVAYEGAYAVNDASVSFDQKGGNISQVANDDIVLSQSDADLPKNADSVENGFPALDPLGVPLKRMAEDIL